MLQAAAPHLCAPLAALTSGGEATRCGGRVRSGAALAARVASLARALRDDLRVADGDVVALAAQSTDTLLEAWLAVAAAGAIAAPLNPRWSTAEAVSAAARVGAVALLFDASQAALWHALRASAAPLRSGALLASPPGEADAGGRPPEGAACAEALIAAAAAAHPSLSLRRRADDVVTLVFTSGSTGTPKAAALTHASFAAATSAKLCVVGYCASDVFLHAAPLCHVGGLSSAHAALAAGAAHVFLPRWGAEAALQACAAHSVTALAVVPTMLADLLAAAEARSLAPLPAVRRVLVGGGAAPPALLAAAAARLFPAATFTATYALSEAGSSVAFRRVAAAGALVPPPPPPPASLAAAGAFAGACVGAAAPGLELAVALWPSGARAPPGAQGELLARGAQLMARYWRDEAADAATWHTLACDGAAAGGAWLRTGDVAAIGADGLVWLAGRAKDVVKSGGESVHAAEVEAALCAHPAVAAAAVVGLPHARWGEAVAAAVLLRPGIAWRGPCAGGGDAGADAAGSQSAADALTPEALCAHAVGAAGLARFKAPRFVAAWAQAVLPVGATGKLSKPAVRAALLAAREAAAEAEAEPALQLRSRL